MDTSRIGVALWSLGPTPDEAALRRSLETTASIGLKGRRNPARGETPGSFIRHPRGLKGRRKRPSTFHSQGVTLG